MVEGVDKRGKGDPAPCLSIAQRDDISTQTRGLTHLTSELHLTLHPMTVCCGVEWHALASPFEQALPSFKPHANFQNHWQFMPGTVAPKSHFSVHCPLSLPCPHLRAGVLGAVPWTPKAPEGFPLYHRKFMKMPSAFGCAAQQFCLPPPGREGAG